MVASVIKRQEEKNTCAKANDDAAKANNAKARDATIVAYVCIS